ncbi:MAG TPA: hypothetical protein VFB60_24790 [Ktedonobacteraceae bacterium]|nr:hypothetical protein [Ktedonobacteraceae bacterium]
MVMSTGTSLTSLKPTRMCMRLTQQDIVPVTSTVLVLERVRTLPSGLLTVAMSTNAYVVHEVVQALRCGSIGTQPFTQVLLVGHSLGSAISWIEASTYHDVNGVIISGLLHLVNATNVASVVTTLYAATLDPRFAADAFNLNYAGYLTTKPRTRGQSFYYLPNADPQVIATDEATKETVTPVRAWCWLWLRGRQFRPARCEGQE